jgi:hypothetical protein
VNKAKCRKPFHSSLRIGIAKDFESSWKLGRIVRSPKSLCRTSAFSWPLSRVAGDAHTLNTRLEWPRGLHQLGNTCYLNSLLQVRTSLLYHYLTLEPLSCSTSTRLRIFGKRLPQVRLKEVLLSQMKSLSENLLGAASSPKEN